MTIPAYLSVYVLTGSVAIVAAILFGLNRALARADWSAEQRARVVGGAALILVLWLAGAIALGAAGAFHASAGDVPTLQYGVFLPILVGALLIWRSPLVGRIIDAVPQQWLVSVQAYRALGVIFLILYAGGKLPGLHGLPVSAMSSWECLRRLSGSPMPAIRNRTAIWSPASICLASPILRSPFQPVS